MRNTTGPRTVSFEDALRNLASSLTGAPVTALPRSQEAVVQYMAEHLDLQKMVDTISGEVLNKLNQAVGKPSAKRTSKPKTTD